MKFCSKCGNELVDDAVICPKCGCWIGDYEYVENDNNEVGSNGIKEDSLVTVTNFICAIMIILSLFSFGLAVFSNNIFGELQIYTNTILFDGRAYADDTGVIFMLFTSIAGWLFGVIVLIIKIAKIDRKTMLELVIKIISLSFIMLAAILELGEVL